MLGMAPTAGHAIMICRLLEMNHSIIQSFFLPASSRISFLSFSTCLRRQTSKIKLNTIQRRMKTTNKTENPLESGREAREGQNTVGSRAMDTWIRVVAKRAYLRV